ncbi:TPR-like protein [Wallemia mellicola]|uniref:TPR-like protein n=1 Tax=Wallemia mellicola TaxID=1708541 RepID=A0AB74KA31_9BASI|nr:TPR-like protein [Wallemia mellicola]
METTAEIKQRLRQSTRDCTERGLIFASIWSAEMASCIKTPIESKSASGFLTSTPARSNVGDTSFNPRNLSFDPDEDLNDEDDAYELAKSYYNSREFERCASVLSSCKSDKSVFLNLYARYLDSERRIQEATEPVMGPTDTRRENTNAEIPQLLSHLKEPKDAFLLYLKGILLHRSSKRIEAMDVLIKSLNAYSWNWSAWLMLGVCIQDIDDLNTVEGYLPQGVMLRLFSVHMLIELHAVTEKLHNALDELDEIFPNSTHCQSQRAFVYYNMHQMEEAETVFDKLYERDPHRTQDLDLYSNIIYVMGNQTKLAALAHAVVKHNRSDPQVCCLIGNYFSIRGEHEKAIMYFRRALRLDRAYLSAWTLMGHEYIELKNSHAAVEAYRRAIDANAKDYRAWYGLAQAYELLGMYNYSLYFYQRATALRPYDQRMWHALSSNYEYLKRFDDAIKCQQRYMELTTEGVDPKMHIKLSKLYKEAHKEQESSLELRKVYDIVESSGGELRVTDFINVYRELAIWELNQGNTALAQSYLMKVVETNAPEREEAMAILRSIQVKELGGM